MTVGGGLNNQTQPTIHLSTTKNTKGNIIIPTRVSMQTMTPKGQKQVTRLLKAQKSQHADHQATVDEKDHVKDEVLSSGATGQGIEAINTFWGGSGQPDKQDIGLLKFMKAKTYKDLKEKMEQNLKHHRVSD